MDRKDAIAVTVWRKLYERSMEQQELAEVAGVNRLSIGRILNPRLRHMPSDETVDHLCSALEISRSRFELEVEDEMGREARLSPGAPSQPERERLLGELVESLHRATGILSEVEAKAGGALSTRARQLMREVSDFVAVSRGLPG